MRYRFYEVLFNSDECVCWTQTPYGTDIFRQGSIELYDKNFFCINPLRYKRADDQVEVFRNILVEFDKGSIEEQHKLLRDSQLPYSTLVFSGNKSLHAIISLATPLATKDEYKALAKRIYAKLGGKDVVDTSVGNPSRLSRTPGAYRDGEEQTLIAVYDRVSMEVLLNWLGPEPEIIPYSKPEYARLPGLLSDYTNYFLMFGAVEGEWNRQLFLSACDMTRAGYEKERIVELCEAITGHLDASDKRTINSAYNNAKKDT